MIKETVTVKNDSGLHARPATVLIKKISMYKSEVTIAKADYEANAKSIMGVLAMAIKKGEEIDIIVEGPDEEEVLREIKVLFDTKFGE
ncbi:HPr family phosphocarrier protein [Alkaliphilus peptidifermentans]|uniref:Phosphocarrier protein HPr n=1 Tax=Alkaliphilus peptidifermentans DSM 18978 TaxID=1120976 RepID=A0A1G5F324_9FIRM|nr:HPr family phosphocarrier protein [Alkaliphilus peptidifermentans]SCY33607.1 phosphocarrier protein [Alkaliphilus peptidifermentans DSM 18978]